MGDADATARLGDCYYRGLGVERDPSRAVGFYIQAADSGSVEGMYAAGCELLCGRHCGSDHARAFRYLGAASEAGDGRAMNALALMYLGGLHVGRDRRTARRLFRKAARLGDEGAKMNLDTMRRAGRRAGLRGIWITMTDGGEDVA